MANKIAVGIKFFVQKSKNRRRSKPKFLRGRKTLGPKSCDRGNRGSV